MKKNKKLLAAAVLSALCGMSAVGFAACRTPDPEEPHVHDYTVWQYNETEHWKECEKDGEKDEVDNHLFVDGTCECGYSKPAPAAKYGSAEAQINLIKDGAPVTDYSDVTVTLDLQGPVITFDKQTGKLTITGLVAGKDYKLKITKPDYVEYLKIISVTENENLKIGGDGGIIVKYDSVNMLYTVVNGAGYGVKLLDGDKKVIEEKTVSDDNTVEFNGLSTKQKYYMSISVYNIALPEKEVAVNQSGEATVNFGEHFAQGIMPPKTIVYSSEDRHISRTIIGVNIEDDFCFAAKFKVTSLETGLDKEVRFGFCMKYGDKDYSHTFLIENGKWRMQQMESWAGRDLTPEQAAALTDEDGEGLIVAIYRNAATGEVTLYYGVSEDDMVKESTPWTARLGDQKQPVTEFGICQWGEEGKGVYSTEITPYGYGKSIAEVFGLEVPDDVSFEADAVIKEYKVEDSALPDGTQVNLSNEKLGSYTLTVSDGKVKGSVPAGEYTVSANGYISGSVTVTEDGIDGGKIYVVKNFIGKDDVVNQGWWNNDSAHDYSQIGEGIVKAKSNTVAFLSDASFDDLEYTVTTKNGNADNSEFYIIYFDDGAYYALSVSPANNQYNYRIENYPGTLGWDGQTFKTNLGASIGWGLVSEADGIEHYSSANCQTTMGDKINTGYNIKLVRSQNKILIYIDNTYVRTVELDEAYAAKQCRFGMVVYDSKAGQGQWKLDYDTDISATVTANTPEHGTVALSQSGFKLGDKVTVTLTPEDDCLLKSLTVGGIDVTVSVSEGQYTFTVTEKDCEIIATFAEPEGTVFEVNATVKKYGAADSVLPDGTEVKFAGTEGTYMFNVENGKVRGRLPAGEYTVSANGYISDSITVTEDGIEGGKVSVVTSFIGKDDVVNQNWWNNDTAHDLSQIGEGIVKAKSNTVAFISDDSFGDLEYTVTTKNGNSSNREFFLIYFEDGAYFVLGAAPAGGNSNYRIENYPNSLGWDGQTFKTNLGASIGWGLKSEADNVEHYGSANCQTTLGDKINTGYDIKFVRSQNRILIYIDNTYVRTVELDASYAEKQCKFGMVVWDSKAGQSEWKLDYKTDIAATVTANTPEHGTVSLSQSSLKLGDKVTVTLTPDAGYLIESLEVSGRNVTGAIVNGAYTFVVYDKNCAVTAVFAAKAEADYDVAVTGNKYGVSGSSIADGTEIMFYSATLGEHTATVTNGRVSGTLPIGEYTVKLDKYLDKTVTVTADGIDGAISLEYDLMYNVVNKEWGWGAQVVLDGQNGGTVVKTQTSDVMFAATNDTYDEVAITATFVKGAGGRQGPFLKFGNAYCMVQLEPGTGDNAGKYKITWNAGNPNAGGGTSVLTDWAPLEGYDYGGAGWTEEILAKLENGTLGVTLVKKADGVLAYVEGKLVGSHLLGEAQQGAKCQVGVYIVSAVNDREITSRFVIEEDISAYTAQFAYQNTADQSSVSSGVLKATGNMEVATVETYQDMTAEFGWVYPGSGNRYGFAIVFGDGKVIRFDVRYNEGGTYDVQRCGWGNIDGYGWQDRAATYDKETYDTTGISFKIIRHGSAIKIYVNGELQIDYADIGNGYADDNIRLRFNTEGASEIHYTIKGSVD